MSLITESNSNLGGDQSWLGSAHGNWNGRTVTVDFSKFTKETHYPKGFVPQGFPLSINSEGFAVPYDGTTLAGHLLNDYVMQTTAQQTAKEGAGILDHGRVIKAKVPFQDFTPPEKQTLTTIIYV